MPSSQQNILLSLDTAACAGLRKADCAGLVSFTGWQKLPFGEGLGLVMGLFLKRWAFSNYIDGAIP
jgi:hypothetical protein